MSEENNILTPRARGRGNVIHTPVSEQKKQQQQRQQQMMAEHKFHALTARRTAVAAKLQRVKDLLGQAANITVYHLETYLRRVDSCYEEYNTIQNEVYTEFPGQRLEQERYFVEFENVYEDLRIELCQAIDGIRKNDNKLTVAEVIPQPAAVNHVPGLPNVPLPSFDGAYEKWYRFKQLFVDLMQKHHHLSDATKLYYLQQCLKGKAESVLSDQVVNENNFQLAWKALEERFENKRTIVDVHIGGLLNLRKMTKESSIELRQLVDDCSRHVEALKFHALPMQGMSEQLVVSLLTSKLDNATAALWENSVEPRELPEYEETIQFLQNRCFVLERCESKTKCKILETTKMKPVVPTAKPMQRVHAVQAAEDVCSICDSTHNVNKCEVLKQMTVSDRMEMTKKRNLCFNCLKRGHRVGQCRSRACTVSGCGKRHHTLLHFEEISSEQPVPIRSAAEQQEDVAPQLTPSISGISIAMPSQRVHEKEILLSTAIVELQDSSGSYHLCRALLDSGSQSSFVTESVVRRLRLRRERVRAPVIGISGDRRVVSHQAVAQIKSMYSEASWTLDFLVVPHVTGCLPARKIDTDQWQIPSELLLADPRFSVPAKVDMLIGAELFFELLLMDRLKLNDCQAMLWNTKLGWIVSGAFPSIQRTVVAASHIAYLESPESNLEGLVQRFWDQEEVGGTAVSSTEDQQCLEHFAKTHRREEGHFVVRLPFRDNVNQLGESRAIAERRFYQLEKKLNLNPDLKLQYSAFINEYISLGHCVKVKDNGSTGFFLPHHAILKPSSSSTKLRVVFDASARSDTNVSLNDVLMNGPTIQDTLAAIVLRSRKYKFLFSADVIKMFRQVRVDDRDTSFQKILYRDDPTTELSVFELKTVTYGTSCAPFCATACLRQLAIDEEKDFPLGARVVKQDVYMDDAITGADSLEEALKCQSQLIELLKRGGFELHKWCANTPELLQRIPEHAREQQVNIEEREFNDLIKTLGLLWDPSADVFLFRMQPNDESPEVYTKRLVLSETAKIFDPLGLLEPVTVLAKLFIQQLWSQELSWDEPLSTELNSTWRQFKEPLQEINEIRIPRRVVVDDAASFEVHGFSDASQKAYGACVYLRSLKSDGTSEMHLLSSKTRVTPLPSKPGSKKARRPYTIPRAELCGALLLSKLVTGVLKAMDMAIDKVSTASLEIFVGSRVREINQLTHDFEWRYISSKDNPADLASRGVTPSDLQYSNLWWHGPAMLLQNDNLYVPPEPRTFSEEQLEIDDHTYCQLVVRLNPCELLTRYSNFRKLQRVVAYLYRFVNNCRKKKTERTSGSLSILELRSATLKIIWNVQREAFADELHMLQHNRTKKSKFLQLAPFLDSDGLLRVGGRLKHTKLPFHRKHQLLLPPGHHVTRILIESLHKELLHVGQQGLLAMVRQRYWPIRGKGIVRQVVKKCVRCFRMNPPENEQFMGNLPDYRVVPAPPFAKTGIDYAGPIYIKQGRRQARVKAYIAVFICMSTKAIHLEVASDLTTEAFLATLQRFVGRRGTPEQLHSDNATNFCGAQSELTELYELFKQQQTATKINEFCDAKEIQWSFIPPRSPNFGGIWEAGVKAAKSLLKKVLCETSLSYEELTTVVVQIEAILNSRPMTQLTCDPNDLTALTPAHFLVGRELTAYPEPSYEEVKVSRLSRWQYLRRQKQVFWARWSSEYLNELQPRGKWYKQKLIIKPGMLVVLREENMAPQQWRMGRIVQTHPGSDNIVRVVTIRTTTGEVKRAISKIAVLPIEEGSV
ncbi:uncharacterized protein LOC134290145 [Aedes albopictus]|uniref:Integrase catalytic domain-containing protein n=1 Tax=Aedes albopictus TaxID=7160 RepID=A0ABM1Y4K8_AEDAL